MAKNFMSPAARRQRQEAARRPRPGRRKPIAPIADDLEDIAASLASADAGGRVIARANDLDQGEPLRIQPEEIAATYDLIRIGAAIMEACASSGKMPCEALKYAARRKGSR